MTEADGIPFSTWQPFPLVEVAQLLADAPFTWGIAGGYAVELFLGVSFREHGDTDIVVFRDEQLAAQSWLADWRLFAADPPGTLRPWHAGEYLPYGIHDIWGHRPQVRAWELQIMLSEVDGDEWFMRRNPQIRGRRDELLATYGGFPCLRVEVQLLFKARNPRPKDAADFQACLPHLSPEARQWLRDQLLVLHPAGHAWSDELR